ncbi:hypothetical protein [Polaribacter sp. Asnod1-A03]|uniref:hypothetical protein n=1 Tax=Polaribacter sp. Asnod1-A03 TaxID=3160581 RepID=UPI003864D68A
MKNHCDLCDHQKLSLQKGNLCGLTDKKPEFNKTCTQIKFCDNLLDILENIIVDIEDYKLSKKDVFNNLILGSIIGISLLICGYLVFNYFFNNSYRVSYDHSPRAFFNYIAFLIITSGSFIFSGYSFIKKAIVNFREHKKYLIILENSKLKIDKVLNLYNQKYKYKIEFDKEVHGIQEIEVNIELI